MAQQMQPAHEGVFDRLLDLFSRLDEERKQAYLTDLEQVSRNIESELETDPEERKLTPEEADRIWDKTLRSPESVELLTEMAAEARDSYKAGKCLTLEQLRKKHGI